MFKFDFIGFVVVAALVLVIVFGVLMPAINSLAAVLGSIAVMP